MKTKRIEMNISNHLLTAFINSDESGLEVDDIKAISKTINSYKYFHVLCPDETAQVEFTYCDITGMKNDCTLCLVEVK